jgi:hypothetical protein
MSDETIEDIDITRVSAALDKITFSSYIIFFFALCFLVVSVQVIIAGAAYEDTSITLVGIVFFAIVALVIRNLWISIGIFSRTAIRRLRFTFFIPLLLGIVSFANSATNFSPINADALYAFLGCCILIGMSLMGLFAMRQLRRSIFSDVSALNVLDVIEQNVVRRPTGTSGRTKVLRPYALLLAFFGALLMASSIVLLEYVSRPSEFLVQQWVSGPMTFVGALLIMRSRRYFVPDARTVLAFDKREPVLYLRSFQDDDISIQRDQNILLDYSLETRLAKYFSQFGPFLAVGAPSEPLPRLGAARLSLTDDTWQKEVAALMGEAKLIVALLATSTWIVWEIRQIFDHRLFHKTILLFPEIRRVKKKKAYQERFDEAYRRQFEESRQSRPGHVNTRAYRERFDELRRELDGTRFSAATNTIESPEYLRALVMQSGGCTRITSRDFGRGSFHFAAILAHYLLLTERTASS